MPFCAIISQKSEIVNGGTSMDEKQKHDNRELYEKQVEMLKLFLEKGVISQAQFDKSYGDLTAKMKL